MSYLHGKDLTVHYSLGGGSYKSVAAARSCDIRVSRELQEVSGPDTGIYKTFTPGRITWSVKCSGLVKVDDFSLLQLMGTRAEVTLAFRHERGSKMLCGRAYISDIQQAGDVHGIATYTATFTGSGEITALERFGLSVFPTALPVRLS